MTATAVGARRRRFTLEVPHDTDDGFGGVIRAYVAGPQVWGSIEWVRGAERTRSGRPEQAAAYRVRFRYRDGVTAAMRLAAGPRRFAIRAAADPDGYWRREGRCVDWITPYAQVKEDPEGGIPSGLSLDTIPGFGMLMRENKDRMVFARMAGLSKS